jgi:hypothetical protein
VDDEHLECEPVEGVERVHVVDEMVETDFMVEDDEM